MTALTPKQEEQLARVLALLRRVFVSGRPGRVTLHHDGQGNVSGKVEVTVWMDANREGA